MSKIKRIRRWLRRKLWRKTRMGPRSLSGMTVQGKRKRRLRSVLILIQESRG